MTTLREAEAALRIAQLAVTESEAVYFQACNHREKAMWLAHVAGLSIREVARRTGMDYRNARRAMHRYRGKVEPDYDSGDRRLSI